MTPKKGTKRPITVAKEIVKDATYFAADDPHVPNGAFYALKPAQHATLLGILTQADASTGKPDSARKRRRASAAKKTGR